MFVPACRLECEQRLVGDAAIRERGERSAVGPPPADGRQQANPGLLREIVALAVGRQSQPPDDALHQRLKAANQFFLGGRIAALCGLEQSLAHAAGGAAGGGAVHGGGCSARH